MYKIFLFLVDLLFFQQKKVFFPITAEGIKRNIRNWDLVIIPVAFNSCLSLLYDKILLKQKNSHFQCFFSSLD